MKEWRDEDFRSSAQEDNNKLLELLGKLLSNWYWFVLSGMIGLAAAFVYLRYSTPVYKIKARVLVSDERKGSAMMGQAAFMEDFEGLLGGVSSVDNEAEIFKTRHLMEQVVRKLNAQVIYYYPGQIRDVELLHSPFSIELINTDTLKGGAFELQPLDEDRVLLRREGFEQEANYQTPANLPGIGYVRIVRNDEVPYEKDQYKFSVSPLDNRVDEYMGRLSVSVSNKQVSIIDLAFEYPLQEKGEAILGTIIDTYIQNNLRDRNTVADSTIAFIDNRLLYVGQELGSVEGEIQTFRQQQQLADISTQSQLLLENSSEYVKELAEIETQLSIVDNVENYLGEEGNERVLPSAVLPGDMVFNGLVERYNALLLERGRRLLNATPENPVVQNLDQQIAALRKDMQANLHDIRNRLRISRDKLLEKTGQLESQVRKVPATERTYLDLARQQQIKQELYVYLLQKREETAISKTANISNSRIIDPPKSPRSPISPKRVLILAFGLLSGLAIPFGTIYLRSLLDTRVRSKDDITRRTRVPIIAEVSHNAMKDTLLVSAQSRSVIAEQFRSLRTNISFYLKDPGQKTVLLTSSMGGEGKSFVALNLAMAIAISGKKVVAMEMDLRKPNLSSKLGMDNDFGFSNFAVAPEVDPSQLARPSGLHENLFLISSGPTPPNPAELIMEERTAGLFHALNESFDFIIIDAPPIGLVTDAQLLSRYANLTLYLVRQGYTHKNQLLLAEDLYRNQKMSKMAIVVNDINARGQYGYGYGNSYGYYDNSTVNRPWWKFWQRN